MLVNDIKQLPNYEQFVAWYNLGTYSTQPIDTLSVGQCREAVSYWVRDSDNELAKQISHALQHNTFFSWNSQDLFSEAGILAHLRNTGYDVEIVDQLPTDTVELAKLCTKLPTVAKAKNKLNFIWSKIPRLNWPWYFITVCLGLVFYFNITLVFWSLFVSWALWAVTELPKHDYIEHRYIVPKNQLIKYSIDFLLYIVNPAVYADRKFWQTLHDQHHKNWRTEKDLLTYNIDQGIVLAMIRHKPFLKPSTNDLDELLKEYTVYPWVFKYLIEIKILLGLVLLAVLGPQMFLYLVLIPLGLKLGFEGQHDWYIIRFGERNYWFLWPLALNQAWHLKHHQTYNRAPTSWDDIFQGPLWVRYINPQYYIARLLFKINSVRT